MSIYARKWVDSAQDRDYWRTFANAALNLRVSYAMELFSTLGFIYKANRKNGM